MTTDRTELYIIIAKAGTNETREVGPLTVRGYSRAHANLGSRRRQPCSRVSRPVRELAK